MRFEWSQDADMLDWFKSLDGKYQTHINQVLRRYMESRRTDK
ncbi:MAG: BrnA antitoxin family protein [Gammaproteobacteria bacterium]